MITGSSISSSASQMGSCVLEAAASSAGGKVSMGSHASEEQSSTKPCSATHLSPCLCTQERSQGSTESSKLSQLCKMLQDTEEAGSKLKDWLLQKLLKHSQVHERKVGHLVRPVIDKLI